MTKATKGQTVECQVCERGQKADKFGCLVNHGYKRPGWGFIVGNCPGVGHQPFPATNVLERYLVAVDNHLEHATAQMLNPTTVRFETGYKPAHYSAGRAVRGQTLYTEFATFEDYNAFTETKNAEDKAAGKFTRYLGGETTRRAEWTYQHQATVRRWAQEVANTKTERERVVARIAKGKALQAQEVAA